MASKSMRTKTFIKKIDDELKLFDGVDLGDDTANNYLKLAVYYMGLVADCLESSERKTVKIKKCPGAATPDGHTENKSSLL